MDTCARHVKHFLAIKDALSVREEVLGHIRVVLRDNPGKKFRSHNKSKSHVHAEEMKTQVQIEKTLNMADKETRKEKENTNELYISKLIKIV